MREIVLYTMPACPQCKQTKELLKKEDLNYRDEYLYLEKEFIEDQLDKEVFRAPILTVQKEGRIIIAMEGLSKEGFVSVIEEYNSIWDE